jgi:hypothetical protein
MPCNARTRAGGRCRRKAMPNHWRCPQHGGLAGRPRGIPLSPTALAARVAGRARWVERMWAAKARGEIARFPGGRRPRGSAPRSQDKMIARAQRIVERKIEMAKKTTVPAIPAEAAALPVKSRSAMSLPAKLDQAAHTSLDRSKSCSIAKSIRMTQKRLAYRQPPH